MSTTRRWICLVAFTVTLATFASAAPPLLNNADVKEVLSKPSQDIRRFDGTVVPEERPTSRNTIRSLFGSLWSSISRRISTYESSSEKLFKGLFASRGSNAKEDNMPVLGAPASNKMDDIKDLADNTLGNPKWSQRATENLWIASLKKLEEDEQALSFVGSLVDKIENFLTAKIHTGEKSLIGFMVKKAMVDVASKETDLNTARENGSQNRVIAKFILEKVKHALVAHFLNGARNENGEGVKAFGSSLIFTLFDLAINVLSAAEQQ